MLDNQHSSFNYLGNYNNTKYYKKENLSEIENTLVITTDKGNNIETQYEMFDGFKIKIPSEFKIMSDEFVNVKYSNRNAPSFLC